MRFVSGMVLLILTVSGTVAKPNAVLRPHDEGLFCCARHRRALGLTLLELMLVLGILGVLSAISVSSYTRYLYRAAITQAIVDIGYLHRTIETFHAEGGSYPITLAEVGAEEMLDPWENRYRYVRIDESVGVVASSDSGDSGGRSPGLGDMSIMGVVRKDRNLVPINTDYDLYSMGRDGASVPALTAAASRDDIIRAKNGDYVGLASRY